MATPVNRRTVNLDDYPDLVAIYLGMRVNHSALAAQTGSAPETTRAACVRAVVLPSAHVSGKRSKLTAAGLTVTVEPDAAS